MGRAVLSYVGERTTAVQLPQEPAWGVRTIESTRVRSGRCCQAVAAAPRRWSTSEVVDVDAFSPYLPLRKFDMEEDLRSRGHIPWRLYRRAPPPPPSPAAKLMTPAPVQPEPENTPAPAPAPATKLRVAMSPLDARGVSYFTAVGRSILLCCPAAVQEPFSKLML
jgi:hypothetical protein